MLNILKRRIDLVVLHYTDGTTITLWTTPYGVLLWFGAFCWWRWRRRHG